MTRQAAATRELREIRRGLSCRIDYAYDSEKTDGGENED